MTNVVNSPTPVSHSPKNWLWKSTAWLLFAAITGGLSVMVWIAAQVKHVPKAAQKTETKAVVTDPLVQLRNHNPNELASIVRPISFDTVVRDMRNYPPQFKDSRFLKANISKWTVQVMNVAEHEVIADYIKGREDKDNFNYFRIVDENKHKRYVLTYGLFNSTPEAINAIKAANFNLPSNITAFPEEIKLYLSQVDAYEVAEPIKDLASGAPREVKLHSTPKLLPAPKAKVVPTHTQHVAPENNHTVAPTTSTNHAIKESTDRNDTLSIQEKHHQTDDPADNQTDSQVDNDPAPRERTAAKSNTDDKSDNNTNDKTDR